MNVSTMARQIMWILISLLCNRYLSFLYDFQVPKFTHVAKGQSSASYKYNWFRQWHEDNPFSLYCSACKIQLNNPSHCHLQYVHWILFNTLSTCEDCVMESPLHVSLSVCISRSCSSCHNVPSHSCTSLGSVIP